MSFKRWLPPRGLRAALPFGRPPPAMARPGRWVPWVRPVRPCALCRSALSLALAAALLCLGGAVARRLGSSAACGRRRNNRPLRGGDRDDDLGDMVLLVVDVDGLTMVLPLRARRLSRHGGGQGSQDHPRTRQRASFHTGRRLKASGNGGIMTKTASKPRKFCQKSWGLQYGNHKHTGGNAKPSGTRRS